MCCKLGYYRCGHAGGVREPAAGGRDVQLERPRGRPARPPGQPGGRGQSAMQRLERPRGAGHRLVHH